MLRLHLVPMDWARRGSRGVRTVTVVAGVLKHHQEVAKCFEAYEEAFVGGGWTDRDLLVSVPARRSCLYAEYNHHSPTLLPLYTLSLTREQRLPQHAATRRLPGNADASHLRLADPVL